MYYTAVADGSNLILYRNGKSVASLAYDGTLKTSFAYTDIGLKPGDTGNFNNSPTSGPWNGYLDDIRIYNRALSAAEVQQLFYAGLSTHGGAGAF
jgi:hypothetical protein